MSTSQERMQEAFAAYEQSAYATKRSEDHDTVFVPLGTRLLRIIHAKQSWRLWLATNDYKHGTYMDLFHNGMILRVTARVDEGDEIRLVRPSDEEIK